MERGGKESVFGREDRVKKKERERERRRERVRERERERESVKFGSILLVKTPLSGHPPPKGYGHLRYHFRWAGLGCMGAF